MDLNQALLVERVNWRTIALSAVAAVTGILLLFVSKPIDELGYHRSGSLIREGGAVLLASVAVLLLWELAAKRAFTDEVLAKANMSRDLAEAGLDMVLGSFQDKRLNWDELFKNACKMDLFIAYGHTWRNSHAEQMDKMLADSGSRLRAVLPDPNDGNVIAALSSRFKMKPEEVTAEIEKAKEFFDHRQTKAKGNVEIYVAKIVPLFTFYRFNNKVVFALYNHREGRNPVPTFVADEDGFLFKYFTDEIEGIIASDRTRRVDTGEIKNADKK